MTYGKLYSDYYRWSLRYARKFTRSEAKDVVQGAWLYILENVRIDEIRSFEDVLFKALYIEGKHHENQYLRRHQTIPVDEVELAERMREPNDTVMDKLKTLPLKYRRILEYKVYGFSDEEIAKIEGISPVNVRVRKHRARNLL